MALAADIQLDTSLVDYVMIAGYFAVVLGVGILARRSVTTSMDFLLAGRSMPAWITGLAFLSANLGAIEVLGMTANGAAYGLAPTHYYWIGAVPAMVVLGLIMMPFYYGSKVRSVPEYLRLRYNRPTHLLQSILFAVASILIAGINLYALALIVNALIGWPVWISIAMAAVIVLAYTFFGGLSAAIYNEVLQFFVIVAALLPLTFIGLHRVGGWDGLTSSIASSRLGSEAMNAWNGTGLDNTTNPYGNWIGIALGLGFVLSFGYWTTNFAEVQRALSARDMSAARRTPLIAAFPKMLLPVVVILPGVLAVILVPGIGDGTLTYNDALPALINELLPNGLIGLAIAGLLASFMAGMAANLSAFNTVVTYDIWQPYIRPGQEDVHYLRVGRTATTAGVVVAIGAAFLAAGYNNIGDYIQTLNSFFNAPLFATFIVGMFWVRITPWAGFAGLVSGILGAAGVYIAHRFDWVSFSSDQSAAFWGAGVAFAVDVLVMLLVTTVTRPKPVAELTGLVWSTTDRSAYRKPLREHLGRNWYQSVPVLSAIALVSCVGLNLIFG
ncbi:sodium:solute symporter family protein [Nocardia carnea]|uniref:sodium:solute symporter family protein n=1 Tax=Nocardia carnea TaxID=37328 RepID=UPI00245511E3|nr:sodium:solute symporter family protein [Nocardia carnea]